MHVFFFFYSHHFICESLVFFLLRGKGIVLGLIEPHSLYLMPFLFYMYLMVVLY